MEELERGISRISIEKKDLKREFDKLSLEQKRIKEVVKHILELYFQLKLLFMCMEM